MAEIFAILDAFFARPDVQTWVEFSQRPYVWIPAVIVCIFIGGMLANARRKPDEDPEE
jgi:hypothetical protein